MNNGLTHYCTACETQSQSAEHVCRVVPACDGGVLHAPPLEVPSRPVPPGGSNPGAGPLTGTNPPPKPGGVVVVDHAIAYLRARAGEGKRKYGQYLMTHDGRDTDLDALEEAADLFMYLYKRYLEKSA